MTPPCKQDLEETIRSVYYYMSKDPTVALQKALNLVTKTPPRSSIWFGGQLLLGDVYLRLHNFDRLMECLFKCAKHMKLANKVEQVYHLKTLIINGVNTMLGLGMFREVIKCQEKLSPTFDVAHPSVLKCLLLSSSKAYFSLKDFDQAIPLGEQALVYSNNTDTREHLFKVYIECGNLDQAKVQLCKLFSDSNMAFVKKNAVLEMITMKKKYNCDFDEDVIQSVEQFLKVYCSSLQPQVVDEWFDCFYLNTSDKKPSHEHRGEKHVEWIASMNRFTLIGEEGELGVHHHDVDVTQSKRVVHKSQKKKTRKYEQKYEDDDIDKIIEAFVSQDERTEEPEVNVKDDVGIIISSFEKMLTLQLSRLTRQKSFKKYREDRTKIIMTSLRTFYVTLVEKKCQFEPHYQIQVMDVVRKFSSDNLYVPTIRELVVAILGFVLPYSAYILYGYHECDSDREAYVAKIKGIEDMLMEIEKKYGMSSAFPIKHNFILLKIVTRRLRELSESQDTMLTDFADTVIMARELYSFHPTAPDETKEVLIECSTDFLTKNMQLIRIQPERVHDLDVIMTFTEYMRFEPQRGIIMADVYLKSCRTQLQGNEHVLWIIGSLILVDDYSVGSTDFSIHCLSVIFDHMRKTVALPQVAPSDEELGKMYLYSLLKLIQYNFLLEVDVRVKYFRFELERFLRLMPITTYHEIILIPDMVDFNRELKCKLIPFDKWGRIIPKY